MAFSLQARVIFPVDRPPIEYGVVTVDGERIVAVGKPPIGGDVIDLGPVALLPGLVNAHTHLEFSHLPGLFGECGMRLVDWIRLVIAERGSRAADPWQAIAEGVTESLGHGVTTIGDIATAPADACGAFELLDATLFVEVIGFSRARAASAYSAVCTRIDELSRAAKATRVGISPHAPYTVSPNLLGQLVTLATTRRLPMAMHLAESVEELELLREARGPFQELLDERSMWDPAAIPLGSRPMDYLQQLAQAPRSLVIHGNYLDAEDRAFLAAHRERMSLVYCPRTQDYFRHEPYPLPALLTAGVRVSLGTDSRASNPDLSVLEEMRQVAKVHLQIDPADVLHMGTMAGAEALGRDDEVGSLTCGKLANLMAIPVAETSRESPNQILESILNDQSRVSAVWYRGQRI